MFEIVVKVHLTDLVAHPVSESRSDLQVIFIHKHSAAPQNFTNAKFSATRGSSRKRP